MVNIIIWCTNKEAEAEYQDYNCKHPQNDPCGWKKVIVIEMCPFLES